MADPVTWGVIIGVVVGGAVGALSDKEEPLRGALIGGAIGGATGGFGAAALGPGAAIAAGTEGAVAGTAGVGSSVAAGGAIGAGATSGISGSTILTGLQIAGSVASIGGSLVSGGATVQAANTQASIMEQNAATQAQNATLAAQLASRDALRNEEQAVFATKVATTDVQEIERDKVVANAAFFDQESRTRQARERQLASIRARLGKSGTVTTEGSPLLVLTESQREIDDELDAIRYNRDLALTGLDTEAGKVTLAGQTAARAARQAAEDSILTGQLRARGLETESSLLRFQAPGVRQAGLIGGLGTVLTGLGSTGLALSARRA